jgi:hypothetical protein
MVRCVLFGQ